MVKVDMVSVTVSPALPPEPVVVPVLALPPEPPVAPLVLVVSELVEDVSPLPPSQAVRAKSASAESGSQVNAFIVRLLLVRPR
jgi:hypothetical protein